MIIYAIFTLFFTLVLIFVMNDMLIAYALSVWFFTKVKATVQVYCLFFSLKRFHFVLS